MSTKEKIGEALVLMFETFNREPKPQVIAVYINKLENYDLDDALKAISKSVETERFCPTVASILEKLEPSEEDKKASGSHAWYLLDQIVRGRESLLPELKQDPVAEYLLATRFDYERLQEMSHANYAFVEKQFLDAYLDHSNSEKVQEHIGLTRGGERNRIGSNPLVLGE